MKKEPTQKISKKQLVKNWFLSGRTLTHRQCSRMFGADRLADIVFNLRQEGMNIESPLQDGKDRFLNDVHYSKYKWLGEKPVIKFVSTDKKLKVKRYNFFHKYPMPLAKVKLNIQAYIHKLKTRVKKMETVKNWGSYHITVTTTSKGKKFFVVHDPQKPRL